VADRARQRIGASEAVPSLLDAAARDLLDGEAPRSANALDAEYGAVTPADVRDKLTAMMPSLLVATPGTLPAIAGRMKPVPGSSSQTIVGRTHEPLSRDAEGGATLRLIVGQAGVTLKAARSAATVEFSSCAVLLHWSDRKVTLIGNDGFQVLIEPERWNEGDKAVEEALAGVSPSVIVRMDRPGPTQPSAATAVAAPKRGRRTQESAHDRSKRMVTRRFRALHGSLLACGLAGVAVMFSGHGALGLGVGSALVVVGFGGRFMQILVLRRRLGRLRFIQ